MLSAIVTAEIIDFTAIRIAALWRIHEIHPSYFLIPIG